MRLYIFLLVLLTLSGVLAVNNCNPFYYLTKEYKTTCPGSYIEDMGTQYNIEIMAKLADCDTTQQKKSVSLVLSDPRTGWVVRRTRPEKQYYFEYKIRWEYPDSHCIVDLVPDDESKEGSWIMTDQNGIPNTPFESLKEFALFKSYTRRFILDAKSPTKYRLAFRCTRDPDAQRTSQRVMVEGIRFGQVDKNSTENIVLYAPSAPIYDCWNAPYCNPQRPHKNSTCVWVPNNEDPVPMWYHEGGWYMDEVDRYVTVPGNLHVDNALSSMKAGGCIKPWRQQTVSVVLRPEMHILLEQSPECEFSPYNIIGKQRPPYEPQPFQRPPNGCKYALNLDQVEKKSEGSTGSLFLSAPREAWFLDCPKKNPKSETPKADQTRRPITIKGNDAEIPIQEEDGNTTYIGLLFLLSLTMCGVIAFRKFVGKPRRKIAP
jgi:hypothetical protein